MAGSNLDEVVTTAVNRMSGGGTGGQRSLSRLPLPVIGSYLGFLGFGCGLLIGTLTDYTTLVSGFVGAALGVAVAIAIRVFRKPVPTGAVTELNTEVHDLEQEATRLEAEVARQSGAFEKWEQK